jgi:glycosyltransferase involved in cell wall biosynthesis
LSKALNVLWFQDLPIFPAYGGAQLTDRIHFLEGARRGYKLDPVHPQEFNPTKLDQTDLVILSNVTAFPEEQLSQVIEKKPFILFMHDYPCRWRGYFPGAERCLKCNRLTLWRRLFMQSRLNIFLSPLHYEMHTMLIPEIADRPHVEIPSPIDTSIFYPKPVERKAATVLWLGPFTRYKGIHLAIAFSEAKKQYIYTFMGQDVGGIEEGWTERIMALGHTVLPGVPNEMLPNVYSQFEYFLELPGTAMPCERVALEARCCGCKLFTNELLGAASYDWFRHGTIADVRDHVTRSPQDFWEAIEKHV